MVRTLLLKMVMAMVSNLAQPINIKNHKRIKVLEQFTAL